MPAVNPEVLVWARKTAGLTLDEAASKLELKDARGVTGADRLLALENGRGEPSRPLLLRMAKHYRRPLLAFYLANPPRKGDRGEDFRSLPQQHTQAEPLVDALVRDVRARQSMIRSLAEDDEDARPLAFVRSMSIDSGVGAVLDSMTQTLEISLEQYRAQGTVENAFAYLRDRAEAAGVFVLLIGNLGSHHTTLEVSAFRGFAIADDLAPLVVINDQDARQAWSFTLLHELAHLWLGASGVSGSYAEGRLERFCNDVASSFLLPANELQAIDVTDNTERESAVAQISEFAQLRFVSRSLIAYRLFRAGRISNEVWSVLTQLFQRDWRQLRDAQRARDKNREGGGAPDYYVVRRHRLGKGLLRFVDRSMREGLITPTKAGKVLGVKPRNVEPLLSALHRHVA